MEDNVLLYHSLISQSSEFDEASKLIGLSLERLGVYVPGGAIGLGWEWDDEASAELVFWTASELITANDRNTGRRRASA